MDRSLNFVMNIAKLQAQVSMVKVRRAELSELWEVRKALLFLQMTVTFYKC